MTNHSFHFSCVSNSGTQPATSASKLLSRLLASPEWDEVSIFPQDDQFPRLSLAWRGKSGFVVHCFESATSHGDFVIEGAIRTEPEIEINLGGQALERWPRQLFVSEHLARRAVEFFLREGARDPSLDWIGTGAFHRETVWERDA